MDFIEYRLGVNASVGLPLGEAGLEMVRHHFSSKIGGNLKPLNWRILAEVTMGAMLNLCAKEGGLMGVDLDDPEAVAKWDQDFLTCLQPYENELNTLFRNGGWDGNFTPNIPIKTFTLENNSKDGKVQQGFWKRTLSKMVEYRSKVEAYKELGR
jgi:hypothetical protein